MATYTCSLCFKTINSTSATQAKAEHDGMLNLLDPNASFGENPYKNHYNSTGGLKTYTMMSVSGSGEGDMFAGFPGTPPPVTEPDVGDTGRGGTPPPPPPPPYTEPDVGDTGPRGGTPPPVVEPDVRDTGPRDTVYSKQDLKNIVSLYDDPRFDDDERRELIANIENNSITTPTQVNNYANYYITHNSTDHGGGDEPGGGDNNPPVYRPPVDTRSTEQKQADFYKAAQSASDKAALGDSTQLRNFDKFFHIDRPENEYTANFQKAAMGFSEGAYLKANPDVAQAVADGTIESGLAHYISSGRAEGRNGNFTPEGFNEEAYLAANPDVAAAVADGRLISGLDHYLRSGWNEEGRDKTWLSSGLDTDTLASDVTIASGSAGTSNDGSNDTPNNAEEIKKDKTDTQEDTKVFAGGSENFDETTGQYKGTPPSGNKGEPKGSYSRNDEDSGFAYPWSAAQSTGTTDVKGTIAKAVAFMNDNEGKDYVYDDVKGTIISKSTGSFMSKKDTQALNHVIVDYYKQDFKLPGAAGNMVNNNGGGIESGATQFYTPNGVGAAKIDSNNELPTVGNSGGAIAGAAPVKTDGGTVPLP